MLAHPGPRCRADRKPVGDDPEQLLPQRGFSPVPWGTPRGISSPNTHPRAAGRAARSPQEPFLGNPVFPPGAGDQDAVEDPLKRGWALTPEGAQRRADFWCCCGDFGFLLPDETEPESRTSLNTRDLS